MDKKDLIQEYSNNKILFCIIGMLFFLLMTAAVIFALKKMFTISVLLVMLGLGLVMFAVVKTRRGSKKPDYYTFFVLGIIWTAAGIPLDNYGLSAMGVIFLILGLVNKDKWEENRRNWKDLTDSQKRLKLIAITLLSIGLLAGVTFYLFAK